MKYLAVCALILFSACLSNQQASSNSSSDTIVVNGKSETIPTVTDISSATAPGPTDKPITTTNEPTPITNATTPTPITTPSTPTTKKTTTTKSTTPTPTTTVSPNPNVTTTTLPPTPTPTTSKPINPTTETPEPRRRFDGPSFVGGIVLALGLVAIGFVAFKFYKARTEQNYHTL